MVKSLKWTLISVILLTSATSFAQESQPHLRSNAEALQLARTEVSQIQNVIAKGQDMLVEAQGESNVTRMDCLNSLLVIARGFLNVAQNAQTNLEDAIERNDKDAIAHHSKLLSLANSKTEALASRMSQCTAGVVNVSNETQSTTTRKCEIEPCLGGEEVYDSSQIDKSSLTGADSIGNDIVDASPYL